MSRNQGVRSIRNNGCSRWFANPSRFRENRLPVDSHDLLHKFSGAIRRELEKTKTTDRIIRPTLDDNLRLFVDAPLFFPFVLFPFNLVVNVFLRVRKPSARINGRMGNVGGSGTPTIFV